ncbi:DUF1428 domain-containing protein [Microbulbifer pacificus]|uniref:DUF1428 domain-containing protein n=1 Tax=Microbulbifer pacificus TaxID=407164 RepID=UPI000CF456D6|nr:DUF1428 domain-containing protein [Microbulbifer pacificus]
MSRYVDGFVVPVPRANLDAYLALATLAGEVWKEYGALEYVECVADDVPEGEITSFPMSVKLEEGEVVVFSWITYPSREARDEINKKVMADPRIAEMGKDKVPFDGRRMIWGGFKTLVER